MLDFELVEFGVTGVIHFADVRGGGALARRRGSSTAMYKGRAGSRRYDGSLHIMVTYGHI